MRKQSVSVGAFLRARRELVQPEDVGLSRGTHRRVPGLRREEVARSAGISPEYYLRLEQGRDHQPSAQVLESIGHALRLDPDGMAYLHRLAYPPPRTSRSGTGAPAVHDGVRELLPQWDHLPVYVTDQHLDVLTANDVATAMAPGVNQSGANLLEAVLAAEPQEERRDGWEQTASALVAALRYYGDLASPRLHELVGALSIGSEYFRRSWAAHEARPLTGGLVPTYVDPLGWVELHWISLEVPGQTGQHLIVFFGDEGSPAASAIAHLATRV